MSEESFDLKQESPEEMDQESKMEMPDNSVALLLERDQKQLFMHCWSNIAPSSVASGHER